jgi:hypothetical protein
VAASQPALTISCAPWAVHHPQQWALTDSSTRERGTGSAAQGATLCANARVNDLDDDGRILRQLGASTHASGLAAPGERRLVGHAEMRWVGPGGLAMTEPPNGFNEAALPELTSLLIASGSFEEMVQSVCELAARLVPMAATCAITLVQDGHAIFTGSADALAGQLDEQEHELHQGPCLQALATGAIISAPDLSREDRWNGFPTRAIAHGISSIYFSPLRVSDQVIGVLNMYGAAVDAFDEEARALIALLVTLTSVTISTAMGHFEETQLSGHLRRALSNRSVIDQAIGIIIASQNCGPNEAFDVLRTASQDRNIRVRDVASQVVQTAATPQL